MARLTDRDPLTSPATDDLLHIVDVSDTTGSPEGTSKKIKIADLPAIIVNNIAFGFNDVSLYATAGTPLQQGWTEQLNATITTQTDSVFSTPRKVYDYIATGGGVGLNTTFTLQDVQDSIDFGNEFGGVMRGLVSRDYLGQETYSNFSFDVALAQNPLADTQSYRMICFLQNIGNFYNLLIDSDAGDINYQTTTPAGEWIDIRLKLIENPTATLITDMRADLIVNGETVLSDLNVFQGVGAGTNRVGCFHQVWLSGQQVRLSEFGVTIYTDSSTRVLTNSDIIGFKKVSTTVPKGKRDYRIEIAADLTGTDLGFEVEIITLNIGGRVTTTNLGSPPTVLLNGLDEISLVTNSVSVISGVNTEGGKNIWDFSLPTFHTLRGFTFFDPVAASIGFGVEKDDSTGAKIQIKGGLSIDGHLVPKPEFFEIDGADGDFSLPENAAHVELDAGTGVVVMTLPPDPLNGDSVEFYTRGDVATNNIHVISGSSDTVDGLAIRIFNKNSALCIFIFNNGDWNVLHEHGKTSAVDKFLVSIGTSSQALTIHDGLAATETVLDLGTASNGFFSITAAYIEILQDIDSVQIILEVHVTKTLGGSDSIYSSWIEISSDSGVSWDPLLTSLRTETLAKDGDAVFLSELSLDSPTTAGILFRLKATNTGSAAISVLPPPSLIVSTGTAAGFATKISLRTD